MYTFWIINLWIYSSNFVTPLTHFIVILTLKYNKSYLNWRQIIKRDCIKATYELKIHHTVTLLKYGTDSEKCWKRQ
jgi:hypothetical protein